MLLLSPLLPRAATLRLLIGYTMLFAIADADMLPLLAPALFLSLTPLFQLR